MERMESIDPWPDAWEGPKEGYLHKIWCTKINYTQRFWSLMAIVSLFPTFIYAAAWKSVPDFFVIFVLLGWVVYIVLFSLEAKRQGVPFYRISPVCVFMDFIARTFLMCILVIFIFTLPKILKKMREEARMSGGAA